MPDKKCQFCKYEADYLVGNQFFYALACENDLGKARQFCEGGRHLSINATPIVKEPLKKLKKLFAFTQYSA